MRDEESTERATALPQNAPRFRQKNSGSPAMRTLPLLVLTFVALAPAAHAQPTPDGENGRYTFSQVSDGMLRLDTRTGQVSLCAKKDAGWACNTVPDERQALESEIARLQRENGTLKKDMLARGLPLPGRRRERAAGTAARVEPESAAAERCRD